MSFGKWVTVDWITGNFKHHIKTFVSIEYFPAPVKKIAR